MPDLKKKRHVVSVEIDGFKGIDHLAFRPTRTLTVIGGKNGSGKSSALDAIDATLRGGKRVPGEPVNHDRKKATVKVGLEDDIEVRWTKTVAGAPQLLITSGDVEKYDSPRTLLAEALGINALGMDPIEFVDRFDGKQQIETAMAVLGLTDALKAFADERARMFAERTEVNRDAKSLTARVEALHVPDGTPDEPPDVAAMVEAQSAVHDVLTARAGVADAEQAVEEIEERIRQLRMQLSEAKDECFRARAKETEAKEEAGHQCLALGIDPETMDADGTLREKISTSSQIAAAVRSKQEKAELQRELAGTKARADELTREIEKLDAKKDRTVREAKLPVDGLEFTDEGLRLDGTPLAQVSRAEQLMVSCALAVAANPYVPVILIRDGSLLDDDHLELLEQIAEERDCQFLIEMATRDDTPDDRVTIMLTDGRPLPVAAES